ncbi:uncharacterized protein G2W53_012438 [Senna tora]|uniref:Uncharacterized protein n=1 Tax=Senna tora TaxID=362788 RepID=A0A834WNK2_9FABA|nr:uncharacterized protein G2W53_012438 [Senna tora]
MGWSNPVLQLEHEKWAKSATVKYSFSMFGPPFTPNYNHEPILYGWDNPDR